ncbi:putative holin [Pseudomonas protegens]|uniref:putative holin n=1 Tax=Pseudomonas protegens TaxID=380021 RepID=UPI0038020576
MAEPSAGVMATTAVVGMTTASLIPGVDVDAVVGGFAGAMFFVVYAKDLAVLARLGYFIASWVFGYYAASEIIGRELANASGLAAFFGAMLCVGIGVGLLEWFQGGKEPAWMQWFKGIFKGGRNG